MADTENSPNQFPYKNSIDRLNKYEFNKQLFDGDHFAAFKIKIDDRDYNKTYSQLRYIVNNFPGLLAKVSGDFLFGTAPRVVLPVQDADNPYSKGDGDGVDAETVADATDDVFSLAIPKPNPNQEWLENLWFENKMDVQLYESAVTNAYKGDAIFKVRIGSRRAGDEPSIIIEQIMPEYYFPDLDPQNVNAEPSSVEIAFAFTYANKQYLRKEIHTPGKIENKAFLMKDTRIVREVSLAEAGLGDLAPEEATGIDRILVVHIPNWSDGTSHFGIDDFKDLISLFYALNNRLSLIDNILDKHADPILAVPEGVLDESGNIDRSKLGVYEKDGDGDKPEYIVWDAKLEASFQQIESLIQALYMFSETSPSVFGNTSGTGAHTESGRALKYRLMRTVAKIRRKQRYYDYAIKEIVYIAQGLAKAHSIKAEGVAFQGEPEIPSIEWADPIPVDSYEQAQEEELRLASGNQSLKDAIKNIDGIDDEQAVQKIQEIHAEKQQMQPAVPALPGTAPSLSDPFAEDVTIPSTPKAPNATV